MPAGGKNYFPELTGIRAVAMYGIYNCHFNLIDPAKWGNTLYRLGQEMHLGVPVFYVLSGFLIYYLYGYKLERLSVPFGLDYAKNRVARIYPVYFILLTITYFWRGFPNSVPETLVTYTLTQALFPDFVHAGIAQTWTLTIEETFYFTAPFIFLAALRWGLLVPCVGIFAFGIFLVTVDFPLNPYYQNASHVFGRTLCGMIACFGFGILLGKIVRNRAGNLPQRKRPILTYGALAVMFAIMLVQTRLAEQAEAWHPGGDLVRGSEHPVGYFLSYFVFPGFVMMWFWGMMTEASAVKRFLSIPLLVLLGRSSYCFYLLHFGVVSTWLEMFITHNRLGQILLLSLLAVLMFKLIEHPANQYIKFLGRPPKSADDLFSGNVDRRTFVYVGVFAVILAVQLVPLSLVTQHHAAMAYTLLATGGWLQSFMLALYAAAGVVFVAGVFQTPVPAPKDNSERGRRFSLAVLAATTGFILGDATHWGGQFTGSDLYAAATTLKPISEAGMWIAPALGVITSSELQVALFVMLCAYLGCGALISAYFNGVKENADEWGIPLASPRLGIVLGASLVWYLGVDRSPEIFAVVLSIVLLAFAIEITIGPNVEAGASSGLRTVPMLGAFATASLLFLVSIATGHPGNAPRVQAAQLAQEAKQLFIQGDIPASIEASEAALELWPDDTEGLYCLGLGYFQQDKLEPAATALTRVIKLDPAISEAHRYLGIIRLRQRRLEEAYYHLRDAVSANEHSGDAHNSLGIVLEELGELEMAIGEYEIALRLAPELESAEGNLMRLRERLDTTP